MEDKAISADKLTRKFGDFTAVNKISFEVNKGEIFGFLGANGAGKTTAIKMLSGLLRPSGGAASVAGFDVFKQAERIKQNIGYMSQKFSLYEDLTVYENMKFYGGIYGLSTNEIKGRSATLLERLGLQEEKNSLVNSLPLGWKQKLAFTVSTLHQPKIIFLDEPTSGVDPITRRQFWNMIYETADQGTTIFITTHYMEEASYLCDRIVILDRGEVIAQGTLDELLEAEDMKKVAEFELNENIPSNIDNSINGLFIEWKKEIKKGRCALENAPRDLPVLFDFLEKNNLSVKDFDYHKPTLDDLFLQKTGRKLRQ